jgi:fructokinase
VSRAAAGEARAAEALAAWTERLARAFATIVNVLDPDVIVCGGGLSRLAHIYRDVPTHWTQWVFSDQVVTKLLPATHGDASGVRGAARLWSGDGHLGSGDAEP